MFQSETRSRGLSATNRWLPLLDRACSKMLRPMPDHLYSVYIMSSHTGVLYIGITSELQHRVCQHKNGAYDGFTK